MSQILATTFRVFENVAFYNVCENWVSSSPPQLLKSHTLHSRFTLLREITFLSVHDLLTLKYKIVGFGSFLSLFCLFVCFIVLPSYVKVKIQQNK